MKYITLGQGSLAPLHPDPSIFFLAFPDTGYTKDKLLKYKSLLQFHMLMMETIFYIIIN